MFEIMNRPVPESNDLDRDWADALTVVYNKAMTSAYTLQGEVVDCDMRAYDQTGKIIGSVTGADSGGMSTFQVTVPAGVTAVRLSTRVREKVSINSRNVIIRVRLDGTPTGVWIDEVKDWSSAKIREMVLMYAPKLVKVPSQLPPKLTRIQFFLADLLNDPNISLWDMTNITSLNSMFNACKAFNQPVNQWNVANVTDMNGVFNGAAAFNQTIKDWAVSQVTVISYLFNGASSFNKDLSSMIFKSNVTRTNYDTNAPAWNAAYRPKFTGA